jgi:hypothetical protein
MPDFIPCRCPSGCILFVEKEGLKNVKQLNSSGIKYRVSSAIAQAHPPGHAIEIREMAGYA